MIKKLQSMQQKEQLKANWEEIEKYRNESSEKWNKGLQEKTIKSNKKPTFLMQSLFYLY